MNENNLQEKRNDKPITTIDEFIQWTKALTGNKLLYRGLANSTWGVEASGYRRIKKQKEDVIPPVIFQNYIKQLLDSASLQGFKEKPGRKLSDLELLSELQHNGAATCLIGFTANLLVALWFACRDDPENTAKVVAMQMDDAEIFFEVKYADLQEPITEFFAKEKLCRWVPGHQNNRSVAQNSVFVFGKEDIGGGILQDCRNKRECQT